MSEIPPSLFIEPPGPLTPLPKALPASPYDVPPAAPQESPLYVAPSGDLAIAGRDPLLQGVMDWRQQMWDRLSEELAKPLQKYDPSKTLGAQYGSTVDLDNPLLMAFAGPGAIAGVGSRIAPTVALDTAKGMLKSGAPIEDAFANTGWFKGVDEKWRHIISDENARLGGDVSVHSAGSSKPYYSVPYGRDMKLPDVLDHPELYDAYPHLRDIDVKPIELADIGSVQGWSSGNTIALAPALQENFLSTLMHEVQHQIQDYEGFARGGNTSQFLPPNFAKNKEIVDSSWGAIEGYLRDIGLDPVNIRAGLRHVAEGGKPWQSFIDDFSQIPESYQPYVKGIFNSRLNNESLQMNAWQKYRNLAGEVESRSVEEMLAQQDWSRMPQQMEGYPQGQQIVQFKPGEAQSIRAYHGTPHLFPAEPEAPFGRFRDEAIGTGEGAQAYGWGHYVAGNPKVAKEYIPSGESHQLQLNGKAPTPQDIAELQMKALADHGPIGQEALDDIQLTAPMHNSMQEMVDSYGDIKLPGGHPDIPLRQAQFSLLNHMQDKGYDIGMAPGGGHLLEVHILPDESELLDWDKPLGKQSSQVQAGLARLAEQKGFNDPSLFSKSGYDTGEYFYRGWANDLGSPQAASQALHEAGIPGLRYLDAGSRIPAATTAKDIAQLQESIGNAQRSIEEINKEVEMNRNNSGLLPAYFTNRQEQIQQRQSMIDMWSQRLDDLQNERHLTRNYVIFHPSNLEIRARNGQRLEPVDHDPFEGVK